MFGRLLGKGQEVAEESTDASEQRAVSDNLDVELRRIRRLIQFANSARMAQFDQMQRRGGGWRSPKEERLEVTYREPETLEELQACLRFSNTARANGIY